MPTVDVPLTTYQIKQNKPNEAFGSPARLLVQSAEARILCKVPIDVVPPDGVVTSATVNFIMETSYVGSLTLRAAEITENWGGATVTWEKAPAASAPFVNDSISSPAALSTFPLDVTGWFTSRKRFGLEITTTSATRAWIHGSGARWYHPYLRVTYYVPVTQPGGLAPNGGYVSVARPILVYAPDSDSTEQRIQYSTDGGVSQAFITDWLTGKGRYDPAGGGAPVATVGQTIHWRVRTRAAGVESPWSGWASYTYDPIDPVTITAPTGTVNDGSPKMEWTVASQSAYRAQFWQGTTLMDEIGWTANAATREWTPRKSIKIPGGVGRFIVWVRDAQTPRVAAEGAPMETSDDQTFTADLTDALDPIDTIAVSYTEPVPTITGTRDVGTPDEVSLFRDGVQVPIWDEDGNPHLWAPGEDFFDGDDFSIPDYTAPPRGERTWTVRTRTAGANSLAGPSATGDFRTGSLWIVNPRTGESVEVIGWGDTPTVDQETVESSIIHVPINGGPTVEPKRRRLARLTKQGSIQGAVLNEDEDLLLSWAEGDPGAKYRLVFGKVNWSVILGDYSPVDVVGYPDPCGPDRVLVSLNWWQRLADW